MQKLIGMSAPEVFQENMQHPGTSWEEIHNSLKRAFVNGEPDNIEAFKIYVNC